MSHVGNKKASDPSTLPGAVALTMNFNRKASNFEFQKNQDWFFFNVLRNLTVPVLEMNL